MPHEYWITPIWVEGAGQGLTRAVPVLRVEALNDATVPGSRAELPQSQPAWQKIAFGAVKNLSVTWAFTGGPHGGWDDGSAWAALDFAPVTELTGCFSSDNWVTAVTDGIIVRTGDGRVVQDIDGDGLEQTGWVVLYMHVEARERIEPGTRVRAGQRIGHPSCEGGLSNATHLHLARKYNGEWIAADGPIPFNLDGWDPPGKFGG